MAQDQLHRSAESDSDYDSEEEEAMAVPRGYDPSDYVDSEADSFADYEEQLDRDFASRDDDQLWEEYTFEFKHSEGSRGLPDLSDL